MSTAENRASHEAGNTRPKITYLFTQSEDGKNRGTHVDYSSSSLNKDKARLGNAEYREGNLSKIGLVIGDHDRLSRRFGRIKHRGGFLGLRHTLMATPPRVELRIQEENQVGVSYYERLAPDPGEPIGTVDVGDEPVQFTHEALKGYMLEMQRVEGNMVVKRINPKNDNVWELAAPQTVSPEAEEVPVAFQIKKVSK